MSYTSSTLLTILNKIESNQVCLPSIQRKFEWGMDRIEMLFDSILNDYPIGTFLIWQVSKKTATKYKFFEVNNDFNLSDGKWQKPRTSETTESNLWALLDGQQRLTSLSIGLQGSYSYKKNKKEFKKYLFYNLIKNDGSDEYKSFKFFQQGEEEKDPNGIWIPVSMFVNTLEEFHNSIPEEIEKYADIETIIKKSIHLKNEKIKEMWDEWKEKNLYYMVGGRISKFAEKIGKNDNQIFSYYLINTSDLDICNEIFVRINSGGVKLSKADLLFSTVVSSWEDGRNEVDGLIKLLKNNGFETDTDFIMRTCLYLVQSDILFKVNSFNDDTVKKIVENFNGNNDKIGISQAIIRAFDFLRNKLHIPDKILKSKNVIIPIIYHIYKGGTLNDDSIEEVQKFIYISLLQKIFGSHGDTLLKDLREGVTNADKGYTLYDKPFNFESVISKISEAGKKRLYAVDVEWAKQLLDTEKGNDSWLILSLIYGKLPYEYQSYDQDHLHPFSLFKKKTYQGDLNYAKKICNTIPNLGFSTPEENRLKKNAHPLNYYLENILKPNNINWYNYYKTFNKIDDNISLELSDFEQFYKQRKQRLLDILIRKLNLVNDNSPYHSQKVEDEYPDIDENESIDLDAEKFDFSED